MGTSRQSVEIPWPVSTFPGGAAQIGDVNAYSVANGSQEGGGRLLNVHAEPLGDGAIRKGTWHRDPGLQTFAKTGQPGYRGSIFVNNLIYSVWTNNVTTVDASGVSTNRGSLPGTDRVSLAQNQSTPPDVVAVSPANGAYLLTTAGAPITPAPYNGGGGLPQPNSVTFQDGYFFYGIGDCRVFASPLNSIGTINSLTFIRLQAKSSAIGMRVIAFSGLLFCFTNVSCEVWSDAANPAPNFPYNRLQVLEYGLLQPTAIAGFEDGFSQLFWVSQDYGVYTLTPGSLAPQKVSTPDLDRLIEAHVREGHQIMAGCYVFAGKRMFTLSHQAALPPDPAAFTWQYNITTGLWNERGSLLSGILTRWRGEGGHRAFGRWLVGDVEPGVATTGNLGFIDDQIYTEFYSPILARLESGVAAAFPGRLRVPRADFIFVRGVGRAADSLVMPIINVSNSGGLILITVPFPGARLPVTGDTVQISGVLGTTEANGTWTITNVGGTTFTLNGSVFTNAYTSGGIAVDISAPQTMRVPQCSISWSDDGGVLWKGPILRKLGAQELGTRYRISIKNTGMTSDLGRRWRWEITDPVYLGFMGGTMHPTQRTP